jgi:hypothetical protein
MLLIMVGTKNTPVRPLRIHATTASASNCGRISADEPHAGDVEHRCRRVAELVAMEPVLEHRVGRHLLEHAMRLHHALGQPGGAAREREAEHLVLVDLDIGEAVVAIGDDGVESESIAAVIADDHARVSEPGHDVVCDADVAAAHEQALRPPGAEQQFDLGRLESVIEGNGDGAQLGDRQDRLHELGRVDRQDRDPIARRDAALGQGARQTVHAELAFDVRHRGAVASDPQRLVRHLPGSDVDPLPDLDAGEAFPHCQLPPRAACSASIEVTSSTSPPLEPGTT